MGRPEPFKYIHFPPPSAVNLEIAYDHDPSGDSNLTLSCDRPLKGLILDLEDMGDDDGLRWSDQAIDLVPGDAQIVTVKGLKGRKVKARYLGDGSAPGGE